MIPHTRIGLIIAGIVTGLVLNCVFDWPSRAGGKGGRR